MEWPRLAKFDEYYPPFGIYQKSPTDPVQLVRCGYDSNGKYHPPAYFGTLTDVEIFCNVFGLDFPPYFELNNQEGGE